MVGINRRYTQTHHNQDCFSVTQDMDFVPGNGALNADDITNRNGDFMNLESQREDHLDTDNLTTSDDVFERNGIPPVNFNNMGPNEGEGFEEPNPQDCNTMEVLRGFSKAVGHALIIVALRVIDERILKDPGTKRRQVINYLHEKDPVKVHPE